MASRALSNKPTIFNSRESSRDWQPASCASISPLFTEVFEDGSERSWHPHAHKEIDDTAYVSAPPETTGSVLEGHAFCESRDRQRMEATSWRSRHSGTHVSSGFRRFFPRHISR